MKHRFPRWAAPLYSFLLTAFTAYVLLDAFVIPRSYAVVAESTASSATAAAAAADNTAADTGTAALSSDAVVVTENSYTSDSLTITITEYREYDTTIYAADIQVNDASALQTAFADSTYGKNITETTSTIAAQVGAILAVNGDDYSARSGYVIRNGVLYRDTSSDSSQEDLVVWADGTFEIVTEGEVSAEELLAQGAQQVLSFGPALVTDGEISVTAGEEVDKAMTSNPRTAIGQIGEGHYVMVVADGRTSESTGLSLYQLAEFMQGLGAATAYNLDGGGSSTMVFNGTVVNNPTTNGNTIKERSVSDIVYIG